jgi:hypothetical protein
MDSSFSEEKEATRLLSVGVTRPNSNWAACANVQKFSASFFSKKKAFFAA